MTEKTDNESDIGRRASIGEVNRVA